MKYTIQNEFISVSIDSLGAQLTSLKKISTTLEYIWCADEKYWGRSSPILFPIVGKLIDDEYILVTPFLYYKENGREHEVCFYKKTETD